MIAFQIYLSAKTVKEALAIRKELIAGGVSEESISFPSVSNGNNVARAGSPSLATSDKGPNERLWKEKHGKGFRCSPLMIQTFGLTGNREAQIARMLDLLASGKVIQTATGYQWAANSGGHSTRNVVLPDDDNEDTF